MINGINDEIIPIKKIGAKIAGTSGENSIRSNDFGDSSAKKFVKYRLAVGSKTDFMITVPVNVKVVIIIVEIAA